MNIQECTKCKVPLRSYWLKDGVCNGCRHPELIVEAVVASHECVYEPRDSDICPMCKEHTEFCSECGSECCGEFPKEME